MLVRNGYALRIPHDHGRLLEKVQAATTIAMAACCSPQNASKMSPNREARNKKVKKIQFPLSGGDCDEVVTENS